MRILQITMYSLFAILFFLGSFINPKSDEKAPSVHPKEIVKNHLEDKYHGVAWQTYAINQEKLNNIKYKNDILTFA